VAKQEAMQSIFYLRALTGQGITVAGEGTLLSH
jgi:hypothetical protein